MGNRYFYSYDEGFWVDSNRVYTGPESEETDEILYEEVDAGEVMNDQDFLLEEAKGLLQEVANLDKNEGDWWQGYCQSVRDWLERVDKL